jgi:hypothetical protein
MKRDLSPIAMKIAVLKGIMNKVMEQKKRVPDKLKVEA